MVAWKNPAVRLAIFALVAMMAPPEASLRAQSDELPIEVREFDKVIRKSDGKEFIGTIVTENNVTVEIVLESGAGTSFRPEELARIERRVTPTQACQNRVRTRLDESSYESQLELGLWAAQYPETREQALAHLVAATKLDPKRSDPYEALGPLFDVVELSERTEEQRDLELGVYMRGLEAGLEWPELSLRAADLFEASDDRWGAIYMLRQVLKEAGERSEQIKKAEQRLSRLLDRDGRREEAREQVEATLAKEAADGNPSVPLLLLKAKWLLEDFVNGATEAGSPFLDTIGQVLDQDRQSPEAFILRGSYFLIAEDFAKASDDFDKARNSGAVGGIHFLTYALLFARQGNFGTAEQGVNAVRKVSALRHARRMVEAYLRENEGNGSEAIGLLEESLGEESAPWQVWIQYLQTRKRLDSDASIENDASRFLERFRNNPIAFSEVAVLVAEDALRSGDSAKARRWLDYAGMVVSGDAEFYLRVGQAHLREGGDPMRARAALEAARADAPTSADVLNALAYLDYREGKLGQAAALFEQVVNSFPEDQRDQANPPTALAYALRGKAAVDAASQEETWLEDFARDDSKKVLNNWQEEETYGIEVGLRGGSSYFQGTQAFQDDGLTVLFRELSSDRLSRVRSMIRVHSGGEDARVGLRLEDGDGRSGLVFFRGKDGILKFSINRGQESEIFEPPPPLEGRGEDDPEHPSDKYDMVSVEWPDAGAAHTMEIRFDAESGDASLFLDGIRVARNIDVPFYGRRGEIRVGVSGAASLGDSYHFEVRDFEIFRRLPEGSNRRRY